MQDSPTALELNRRLLANVLADDTDMAAQETELSAAIFCDSGLCEAERQTLFRETPQPIAFSGELPSPNTYLAVELLDVPVLITRDEQGKLNAMINACAHRGAPLAPAGEAGERSTLVCPFHGWSYLLDGSLRGRPQESSFSKPKQECALQSLAISERGGVIVVAPHPDISQANVDNALSELANELDGYQFSSYRLLTRKTIDVAANWKLVAGLSHEAYHFGTLHRDSLAPVMTGHAVYDLFGRHSRWAFPMRGIEALAEQTEADWPERPPAAMNHTLFPGTILIITPSDAQLIRSEPGDSPGDSVVYYSGVCADPAQREESLAAYDFGGQIFATEDLPAAIDGDRVLVPGQRDLVPTGLAIALPAGYEAQVRPRSGLAARNGVTVLNTPGTIDADYRGEVKVILVNLGDEPFTVTRGMRIAQMVIAPVTQAACADSKWQTVAAMSPGLPIRPIGWKLLNACNAASTSSASIKAS